jgi:hypothetical protein
VKSILPLLVPTTPPSTDRDDTTETAAQTFGAMLAGMMAVKVDKVVKADGADEADEAGRADKTGGAGEAVKAGGTDEAGRTDQVDAAVPSVTTAAAEANRQAAEPPSLALAAALTLMPPTIAKIVTGQESKPADSGAGTTAPQPRDGAAPPAAAPVTASVPVASAKPTVPMTPVIPAGLPTQDGVPGDVKIAMPDAAELGENVVVEKLDVMQDAERGTRNARPAVTDPRAAATPPGADVRVDGPTGTPGSGSLTRPPASQHARVESASSPPTAPARADVLPPAQVSDKAQAQSQAQSQNGSMDHKDHQDKPTAAAEPVTPAKAGASIPTPAFGPQPPAPQMGAELPSRRAAESPSSRAADFMPDLTPATGTDRVSLRLGDDGTRLQVTVRGDTVHARIVAPDAAVAQALTGDVQEMQRALGDKGFGDAKIVVNQNSVGSLDGSAARRFTPDNPNSGDTDRRHGQQADRSQDQQHRSAHQHRSRRERERRDG